MPNPLCSRTNVEIILTRDEIQKVTDKLAAFNVWRVAENLPAWDLSQYLEYLAYKGVVATIGE